MAQTTIIPPSIALTFSDLITENVIMTEFKRTQRDYLFSCKIAAGLPPNIA